MEDILFNKAKFYVGFKRNQENTTSHKLEKLIIISTVYKLSLANFFVPPIAMRSTRQAMT